MSCKSLYDPGNSINTAATAAHMTIKIKDNLSLWIIPGWTYISASTCLWIILSIETNPAAKQAASSNINMITAGVIINSVKIFLPASRDRCSSAGPSWTWNRPEGWTQWWHPSPEIIGTKGNQSWSPEPWRLCTPAGIRTRITAVRGRWTYRYSTGICRREFLLPGTAAKAGPVGRHRLTVLWQLTIRINF